MCVPSAVTSHLPSPCFPEALPALPSHGACRWHGWKDAQALPAPWGIWLCNLHQRCFLKHYWPMWTLPAWAAPCPEGLELVSAIFPSRGVCQSHALPCSPGSIPQLAPRVLRPHVPGMAQVPRSQSSWVPARLALPPCVSGPWGCRESRAPVPLPRAAGAQCRGAWPESGHAFPALPAGACLTQSWQWAVRVDVRISLHLHGQE